MANIKSAIKQIRKDVRKTARHQGVISELKTLDKKFHSILTQEPQQAEPFARTLISKWDRAVSKGIVPKARANRKKSRVAHWLAKVSGSQSH